VSPIKINKADFSGFVAYMLNFSQTGAVAQMRSHANTDQWLISGQSSFYQF
jgi:hypothetical protein